MKRRAANQDDAGGLCEWSISDLSNRLKFDKGKVKNVTIKRPRLRSTFHQSSLTSKTVDFNNQDVSEGSDTKYQALQQPLTMHFPCFAVLDSHLMKLISRIRKDVQLERGS